MLQNAHPLAFACLLKVLPIWALALQAYQLAMLAGGLQKRFCLYLAAGLAVSTVGDVLLETDGLLSQSAAKPEWLFMGGLMAFLAAHVLYIAAFRIRSGAFSALYAVAFGGAATGLYALLYPALPVELRIPVAIYAAVIAGMGYSAATSVAPGGDSESWRHGVAGAITFMVSDAILAIDAFGPRWLANEIAYPKLAVMLTYYLAQMQLTSAIRIVKEGKGKPQTAAGKPAEPAPSGGEAPAAAQVSEPATEAVAPPSSSSSSSARKKRK